MESEETIKRLLREQASSGKRASEYCAERGVDPSKFYEWRRREKRAAQRTEVPEARFRAVVSGEKITLELSNGRIIKVLREELSYVLEELSR
jgi:hypothetical protein